MHLLRQIAALTVAAAGLAGLTAGCGGSGGSASSGKPATYQQMIAYAQCVRSHGAPGFPDPVQDQFGNWVFVSTPTSGANSPGAAAAEKACKSLQPREAGLTPQELKVVLAQALKHTACMRSHGITNFPDPVTQGGGITIDPQGLDMNSPQFQAAQKACQHDTPGLLKGGSQ